MPRKKKSRKRAVASTTPSESAQPELHPVDQPFRFFDLPAEIRNMVYVELALMSILRKARRIYTSDAWINNFSPLLQASRACRDEAKALWPRLCALATVFLTWDAFRVRAFLETGRLGPLEELESSLEALVNRMTLPPAVIGGDFAQVLCSHTRSLQLGTVPFIDTQASNYAYRRRLFLNTFVEPTSHACCFRALQNVAFVIRTEVIAKPNGAFELDHIIGHPFQKRFKTPGHLSRFLQEHWVGTHMLDREWKYRIKSITVTAQRRSKVTQGEIFFDVFIELHDIRKRIEEKIASTLAAKQAAEVRRVAELASLPGGARENPIVIEGAAQQP